MRSAGYRSDGFHTLFTFGADSIDIPNHWSAEFLRREREATRDIYPHIAVVRLQGAQNRILPIQLQYGLKPHGFDRRLPNILLSDLGDIVIGLDDLSIDREMQALMPHPAMGPMQDRYLAPRRGLRHCLGNEARCDPISTASRWQNPAFRKLGDRIEVFSADYLTELAALRADLAAPPPEGIATRFFLGAVVAGALTVLLVVSFFAARRRVRRYLRQAGSAQAA